MRPVFQTRTGDHGNCFKACVASILEMQISDLPHTRGDLWVSRYQRFLKPFGLSMAWVAHKGSNAYPPGFAIAGHNTRGGSKKGHAVVYLNGALVHDPYPPNRMAGRKLLRINHWFVFTVLDPAKHIRC